MVDVRAILIFCKARIFRCIWQLTTANPLQEDFSLSDINLTDAAKYLEQAKRRVEMPDGVVSSFSIRREIKGMMDKTFRIVWSVGLKKGVNEGSVSYDNDGNELSVKKNGETIFEEKKTYK